MLVSEIPCTTYTMSHLHTGTVSSRHACIQALCHHVTPAYRHCVITSRLHTGTVSPRHACIQALCHHVTPAYMHCVTTSHLHTGTVSPRHTCIQALCYICVWMNDSGGRKQPQHLTMPVTQRLPNSLLWPPVNVHWT